MPTAELHFFHADDPNGSTIFECSTDDEFVKQIQLDIQRDSLGSGLVNLARKVPVGLFTREIVEPETLCRILVPAVHATKYYHGIWINPRQQQVVSLDEKGGEGFTFGGPGPKHYLTRQLLWSASFSGIDSAVEKDSGVWTWPETAVAGRILERLFQEDAANPSGPFLPDLTLSFDENDDSDGVPWTTNISDGNDDFTLRIQQDYLKLLWQIEDASGITSQIYLGEVGTPLLRLDAFQTFGRDLTEDVAFVEGHNIRDDLEVEGSSYHKASHALVRGNEGHYELAIKPSWSPGDLKKVMAVQYDSDSAGILDDAGVRALQRQDNGEKQIDLRIVTGFAPTQGRYFPGPDYAGSNGDFWVGDTVSLTTGQAAPTELDYQDEPQTVTGIEVELSDAVRDDNDERRARSFDVTVQLNKERKSSNSSVDLAGNRGTVQAPPQVLKLCRAATEGSTEVTRLYPQVANNAFNPTEDASWDVVNAGASTAKTAAASPDATMHAVLSSTGGGSGVTTDVMMRQEIYTIDSGLAASLVAGGSIFRGQMTCRARSGIGISEASQDLISQIVIRVFDSGGTIRGTVLAGHTLASSAGSTKWRAHTAGRNASFPPAAANNVLSALSGCVAGDRLVIESGYRNFTVPAATGGAIMPNGNAASDLPEDDTSTDLLNAWWQITDEGSGSTTGDLPLDTVRQGDETPGDSARVSRCDHQHAHGLLSFDGLDYHDLAQVANYIYDSSGAPTVNDDSADGLQQGSLWIDHSVSPNDVYILVDPTVGAAVWVELSPQVVSLALNDLTDVTITAPAEDDDLRYNGSVWVNDPRKWEVVTDGEDVLVWFGDDLVFEWNS